MILKGTSTCFHRPLQRFKVVLVKLFDIFGKRSSLQNVCRIFQKKPKVAFYLEVGPKDIEFVSQDV